MTSWLDDLEKVPSSQRFPWTHRHAVDALRQVEGLVHASGWGFKSPLRHARLRHARDQRSRGPFDREGRI